MPEAALAIIRAQPRLAGSAFVFAAGKGSGPFNSRGQRKDELDRLLKEQLPNMQPWVVHDIRRTARTLMARIGVQKDVAEAVLGHKEQGIVAVYNRHRYLDEQTDALKRLAGLIELIVNPPTDNVVALHG